MRTFFAILIALHALIHLIGPAKAFGVADVNQLRSTISPASGVVWLAVAALLLIAAAGVALGASWWWYPAIPGVILSQVLIVSVWSDAKFGTVANVIIAVPLLLAVLDRRSTSFHSRFAHERDALLARQTPSTAFVTESSISALPPLMQTYLRRVGAVGRPRVRNMHVTFRARMRGSATAPWMEANADQYEFFDRPARLFHMEASRAGIPFDVFHRYVDSAATFQVRIAGLIPMVDKHGAGITNDETVTLMNDVLVLAPAAALDMPFTFETLSARTLRAVFRNAGFTVSAIVTFNDEGDLVGFTSTDRAHDREGGAATWSTPISGYREVDGARVGAKGDANWIDASGEWSYGKFEVTSLTYNVAR